MHSVYWGLKFMMETHDDKHLKINLKTDLKGLSMEKF
jgi:hypothetical protein